MRKMVLFRLLVLLLLLLSLCLNAQQAEELGEVEWLRDYDRARERATKEDKAILILFQEVPDVQHVGTMAMDVLSHPLLVDAIEHEFIPLAIFNNKGGKDKEILERFREPSWNNPVVRIIDKNGQDISKRLSGDYSALGLQNAMVSALVKSNKPIPAYLKLAGEELGSLRSGTEEAYFEMYCFWTGEKVLGDKKGVLETESGFMNGKEVVKVTFDSAQVTKEELTDHAESSSCKLRERGNSYRNSPKDINYYLQNSDFRYLPLSTLQRTRINTALGKNVDPSVFLSPSQLFWLKNGKNPNKVLFDKEFRKAWNELSLSKN